MKAEESLHQAVVNYLKYQFPDVEFRTDFAAGVKMSIGQATKHKAIQKRRAWPDIFIAEKRDVWGGLFLELKRDGLKLKKRNGEWLNDHIREQAEVIERLKQKGYMATFSVGFDNAKNQIDTYLNQPLEKVFFAG